MTKNFEINRLQGYQHVEPQPGLMSTVDVQGWTARYVGKGIWDLIPGTPDDRCLVMTGNAVTLNAQIPVNHRLVRFEWKHTDGGYVDSSDACGAILYRIDYEPTYAGAGLFWRMYGEVSTTESTTIVPFGEGFEYMSCIYQVSFQTTQGHFIFPRLWIQEVRP